jgi:C4-dicarboxylate-specific signal transduction histidine kinase
MNEWDSRSRLMEDLAFFGRVTASATHQINNVLSILAELHGLLEDLVQPARRGQPVSPDKLADVTARCQAQVARGVGYVDHLNAFAHSIDEAEARLDVAEALTNVEALVTRMAQMRRASVNSTAPGEVGALETRPFRFFRIVHSAVELALQGAERGTEISLRAKRSNSGVEFEIESSGPIAPEPTTEPMLVKLRSLVEELGGSVQALTRGDGVIYRLTFAGMRDQGGILESPDSADSS